jgi:hypothetical protein
LTDWLRNIWLATRLIYNTQGVPGFGTKCSVSQTITLTSHIYNYHYLIKSESPSIYSSGWKCVYLVLKYTPFYSVLAGSVSLSQEKGVVIYAHFSLLTQAPLPPLFLTLPCNITNYFTAKWETVKQPFYGTQNEIYERLISKSSRIKRWREKILAINRICLSAVFSIHFASGKMVA